MKEDQRRVLIDAWWQFFALDQAQVQAEDKYFQLLRLADEMERCQVITEDEWRKLVQHASSGLGGHSECSDLLSMVKAMRADRGFREAGGVEES